MGVFSLAKPEPGRSRERHVELVQTFADQAAIAIENVRLFDEVQARTRDLSESLQQQTATVRGAAGHQFLARPPPAVFAAMLEKATQLCEAAFGILWLCDGEDFRLVPCTASSGLLRDRPTSQYARFRPIPLDACYAVSA